METFLIKAAQLIIALSLLVVVHEFGHYIFARIFGIKVEKFYLFFNPWFSLFKWKPKPGKKRYNADGTERATWRDTEYGIGWLPLGGYVKIAGMIDESMDKEQLAKEPASWEFRTKPAYQRLLVMVAGVMMNFILAIVIYSGIAWHWGEKYIPYTQATEGMEFVDAAKAAGFCDGDIPLTADGQTVDASNRENTIKLASAKSVTVLRNGRDTVEITLPDGFLVSLNDARGFFTYRVPVVVDDLQPRMPAKKAGMKEGDRVVSVNGRPTPSFTTFSAALTANAGKPVNIDVARGNDTITLSLTPTSDGKIGIMLRPITDIYPVETIHHSLLSSIPRGWEIGTGRLASYIGSMKHVVTPEGAKSVGGFGALGSLFPERWSWLAFWEITAFLSVVLAFMNILPIPALDGGHIMFLLYEIVTRRPPGMKFLEYAQIAGMSFLLLLLAYANLNDILRLIP